MNGSRTPLFVMLGAAAKRRPELSVQALITYILAGAEPTDDNLGDALYKFLEAEERRDQEG